MTKLLGILLVVSVVCQVLFGRWPWQLAGIGTGTNTGKAERQARVLLGVSKDATYKDIVEAHRRLIARVHPDRGGTSEQVHEANAARDLLLTRCRKSGLE